jgi:copper transport protein
MLLSRSALRAATASLLLAGALGVIGAGTAMAHPGDGNAPTAVSAVPQPWVPTPTPPEQIKIAFNAPVANGGHTIEVVNATGKRVDSGRVLRASDTELAVELADADLPGLYTVRWTALIEGHQARGEYNFAYEPPAKAEPLVPDSWLASGGLSAILLIGGGVALRRRRAARSSG